jgi:REP element-mobilizing transposase RayT
MGKSRYTFLEVNQPHFLTCTILNWIAVFGNPDVVQIVLNSLRFLIENNRLRLHGWVIMENHLHLIASSEDLSKQIHDFKSFTARSIIDFLIENHFDSVLYQFKLFKKEHKVGQEYQFWQEGSHPEMILTREMLNQKLDYIHYNPVRRGYVEKPEHWCYSSYSDYFHGSGLLPIEILN